MKAIVILISAPFIMLATIAGLQTIEWHMAENSSIPAATFILMSIVILWCSQIFNMKTKDFDAALQTIEKWVNGWLE